MEPTGTDETKPAIVPIRRVKLYEEVAARIRDLIASGELRPGEALPSERKLAEQFKVGRAVIREAIRQLEVSGLIESRHGGGNYVREVTVEHLVAPIASVLNGMAPLREEVIDGLLEDSQARLFRSVERSEISLEGNRRILEAVLRHDQEAAQRAMAEHLEDIARNL